MPGREGNGVKICIVGNSGVGKSCIGSRLVNDTFFEAAKPTIGSAYMHKEINVDGEIVNLNIWDTAGQERFRALAPLYYRDASAIVLVYDITNERSFESIRTVWVPALRGCTKQNVNLAVVGNKLDLENTDRVVTPERARGYADILGAVFLETSAKTGKNVERLFAELVMKIRETKHPAAIEEGTWSVIHLPDSSMAEDAASWGPSPNGAGKSPARTPGMDPNTHRRRSCNCNH